MTAFEARSKPEPAPLWLWALSWTFWLAVSAAIAGVGVHKVKVHQEQLLLGDATWRIRYKICKRISVAPRPDWRECLARMEQPDPDLLAPADRGSTPPPRRRAAAPLWGAK